MTKLADAFCNFADVLKNQSVSAVEESDCCLLTKHIKAPCRQNIRTSDF